MREVKKKHTGHRGEGGSCAEGEVNKGSCPLSERVFQNFMMVPGSSFFRKAMSRTVISYGNSMTDSLI